MTKKSKDYEYPFAEDFDGYLSNNVDDRNKQNIKSRINTIWKGFRSANGGMKLIDDNVKSCWNELPDILKCKIEYHQLVYQILAAIFISLNEKIQEDLERGSLKDIRSAFVHYYLFVEEMMLNKTSGSGTPKNLSNMEEYLLSFYGSTRMRCFTQKEVRRNFTLRMHSQDRLYNHNLLFPITLIVKLLGGINLSNEWTDTVINNIDILISKDKKKSIKFEEVSLFMFTDKGVYVFDSNKKIQHQVYTRTYRIIENEDASQVMVHDWGQPLKTLAIDHSTPMATLLELHANNQDVPDLQKLSDDFCQYILSNGRSDLQYNTWMQKNPSATGLDILNAKTINDLANGFNANNKPSINPDNIINDIKTLHTLTSPQDPDKMELMDSIQNGIKRDS